MSRFMANPVGYAVAARLADLTIKTEYFLFVLMLEDFSSHRATAPTYW
jgi:hypothetical protein